MKPLSVQQLRELDSAAGAGGLERAMRRAGLSVAEAVRTAARLRGVADLPVILCAGRGNNGGDAFVAAHDLLDWGYRVKVFSVGIPQTLKPLPRRMAEGLSLETDWDSFEPPRGSIVVDGILGTGVSGSPRGRDGELASAVNRWRNLRGAFVIAIDIPSGMSADDGIFPEGCVTADWTIALEAPKKGMVQIARGPGEKEDAVAEYCGRIDVAPLGLSSKELMTEQTRASIPPDTVPFDLVTSTEVRSWLGRRSRTAHKGDFGHVALIGGSDAFPGAIGMAARAALRGGAGLVSVLTTPKAAAGIRIAAPEVMVSEMEDTAPENVSGKTGFLSSEALVRAEPDLIPKRATVLVVGPGLGRSPDTRNLVWDLLETARTRRLPVVLDADGLWAVSDDMARLRSMKFGDTLVLTPHAAEAARLLGRPVDELDADRSGALRDLVMASGAVVVLKGCGTLVGAPEKTPAIVRGGNPGMATGGSGDILAGWTGALFAQGLDGFRTAKAAAFLHAEAGDRAAWRIGERALVATDLLESQTSD